MKPLLAAVSLLLFAAIKLNADGADPSYRISSATVSDGFVLIKYHTKTGAVWSHSEDDKWERVNRSESLNSGDYDFVIAPYSTGGGVNPVSGFTPPVETYTIFRLDKKRGLTWKYEGDTFKEIAQPREPGKAEEHKFELICRGIADSFAIYLYDRNTGMLWNYRNQKWEPIANSRLPPGDYEYKIVPTRMNADHRLFRIDRRTGESWDYRDGGFIPVPFSGQSQNAE